MHGTQLMPAGKQALLCLFGVGLLALINPSVATAKELASKSNTICPAFKWLIHIYLVPLLF